MPATMKFAAPLVQGRLMQRYKRFLADIELDDGRLVTAHCANPGAMLGLKEPGLEAWISPADNPNRKLKWNLELLRVDGHLVGINTSHPNKLAAEAIAAGQISELTGWNANTVRGAIAGALKKKLGLNVVRMQHTAGKPSVYRIEN